MFQTLNLKNKPATFSAYLRGSSIELVALGGQVMIHIYDFSTPGANVSSIYTAETSFLAEVTK